MVGELFWRVVLGHLVGDYLFQSEKMALTKGQKGAVGLWWCVGHSLVYTLSVCAFCWRWDLAFAALVFASHFPIDRWSLANYWLRMIGGRNIKNVYEKKEKYWEVALPFSCLVYERVDMTMHFVLLWGIVHLV